MKEPWHKTGNKLDTWFFLTQKIEFKTETNKVEPTLLLYMFHIKKEGALDFPWKEKESEL